MEKTVYLCDLNSCTNEVEKKKTSRPYQVIFTTEQTEGKNTKPYLYQMQLDMCDDCHEKVVSGLPLYASGAQGHNRYYFGIRPALKSIGIDELRPIVEKLTRGKITWGKACDLINECVK